MKPISYKEDDQRLLLWLVFGGYIFAYIFLNLRTVFFDGSGEMHIPKEIHNAWFKIGSDLFGNIHRCEELLRTGQPDRVGFYFSPLWILFFNFLSVFDPQTLRWIWLMSTIACFAMGCLLMPRYFGSSRTPSLSSLFIAAIGFASYGLMFELERAQWNAIALMLCLLAIVLDRTGQRRNRILAYALFTAAVHLKLWPIFLVVAFIKPKEGLGINFRRMAWLAVINLALLFVLGVSFFAIYVKSVAHKVTDPNIWVGDHSIVSFARQMEAAYGWTSAIGAWLSITYLLVFIAAVSISLYRRRRGDDLLVVVLCVLAGMLLPATSNDYKLVVLTMAMALLFGGYRFSNPWSSSVGISERAALAVIAGCYHLALYSHFFKKGWGLFLQINTIYLYAISGAVIALILLQPSLRSSGENEG